MTIIKESGMAFGDYDDKNLFKIENSSIHTLAGLNIKSVEFILLNEHQKVNNVIILEAKTSCPNPIVEDTPDEKKKKYEKFFSDITDKFTDSINMFAATILNRYRDKSEIGEELRRTVLEDKYKMLLVLVISSAEESWLQGPRAELERRLLKMRQIWKCEVLVINKEIAQQKGLLV